MQVKDHPLQNIAQSGAMPMQKTEALRTGNPDKTSGMMWAQQAIALCIGQASPWTKLALELFGLNIEQRKAALDAWRKWKSEKTKAFKDGTEPAPRLDEKTFKRIMATATVRLSHMSTIAKAIDAGMDVEAVEHHYKAKVETLSIDTLYQLAQTYSKAKAGRPVDTFLVKLGKFLEAAAKGGIADEDVDNYNKVVRLVNKLTPPPAL